MARLQHLYIYNITAFKPVLRNDLRIYKEETSFQCHLINKKPLRQKLCVKKIPGKIGQTQNRRFSRPILEVVSGLKHIIHEL